jgi:hypothetical protein
VIIDDISHKDRLSFDVGSLSDDDSESEDDLDSQDKQIKRNNNRVKCIKGGKIQIQFLS